MVIFTTNLFFAKNFSQETTADEIFRCLDNHFTFKSIDWKNCVGVCTDNAASMTGIHRGVVNRSWKEQEKQNGLTTSCTDKI